MNRFRSKNLKVQFPEYWILCDDFEVSEGEWLEITAPSGFGKTTLLRALIGFQKMEGELWLRDQRVDLLPVPKRNFGVVFQDSLLFPHLNALQNALFGLKLRGRVGEREAARAESAFRSLGLLDRMNAPIQELSGGERQRIALIRAVIFNPDVLLLDEPFKGLDSKSMDQMLEFLHRFLSGHSIPVVWISHQSGVGIEGKRLIGVQEHEHRHFQFHHR